MSSLRDGRTLANELRPHLGKRRSGLLFRSRQGGRYSKRRIQQTILKRTLPSAVQMLEGGETIVEIRDP